MKQTEFNSLTNVETKAAALLLPVGTKFFFNETKIFQDGTMPSAVVGKQKNRQQQKASLRHRIHYYVRDNSTIGYHQVFDLLESDILTQQTKTAKRRGKNTDPGRDDDNARDIVSSSDWV